MTDGAGKRPGGLTALAVLNFVFGGFTALGVFGMLAMYHDVLPANAEGQEAQRDMSRAWQDMGQGIFYGMVALTVVQAFTLIASGAGYLKQSRLWGRKVGNLYALVAIASSLVFALTIQEEAGGGFNLGTVIGLVYPVLTLMLLNTAFKEDFIR